MVKQHIIMKLFILIILFSGSIYANECSQKNNMTYLTYDDKVMTIKYNKNYILINNKYKAYKTDEWEDQFSYGTTYSNKAYTYSFSTPRDVEDITLIQVSNIYGLKKNFQCNGY